jgi:hypothetical protein
VTDLQLENLLLEFETNYRLLTEETSILRISFAEQQKIIRNLKYSNELLLLSFDEQRAISSGWKGRYESQLTVSTELTASLNEATNLSKKAEASWKKDKIKAYVIGGVVGITLGVLAAGITYLVIGG